MLPLLSLIPAIGSAFSSITTLITKYWPNAEDKAKVEQIKAEVAKIENEVAETVRDFEVEMAQLKLNQTQAEDDDHFVKRARPFAMWGVGVGVWTFFGITPLSLLVLTIFTDTKAQKVLALLDTLGTSGYLSVFITIAVGLYGIRGVEKGAKMWRTTGCK